MDFIGTERNTIRAVEEAKAAARAAEEMARRLGEVLPPPPGHTLTGTVLPSAHGTAPVVHNHYYAAPQRKSTADQAVKWAGAAALTVSVLAVASLALFAGALLAVCVALVALVLRQVWNDYRKDS